MTRLVEALRYKPEGCGFDSLWVIGFFYGHTIALGCTHLVTEEITTCISLGVRTACAWG